MKAVLRMFLCVFLAASLCSCSIQKLVVKIATGEMESMVPVFEQDDDMYKLERALPVGLVGAEALLSKDPENVKLLVVLSQLYGSYGMGFFEHKLEAMVFESNETGEDNPEIPVLKALISKYHKKGMDYAARALEIRHPGIINRMDSIETMDSSIDEIKKKDAPALFFYAFNMAMYAYQNMDSMKAISRLHLIEKALAKVIELDETYFHGLAHLALFAANARSPMLGGNLELAMEHYNKLKALTGEDFYMADVQYARFYLYTTQDRKQFIKVLQNVLDNYEKARPEYRMYNAIAAIKARTYLKYIDQLFL